MSTQSSNSDYVAEIHEDRIQRLEDNNTDLSVQMATVVKTVNHLGDVVNDSFCRIEDKIDTMVKPLTQKLESVTATVADLEAKDKASTARWNTVKKYVGAAILAGSGVLGTKLVQLLVTYFGGF